MKKCALCGYKTTLDDSRFCSRCGSTELLPIEKKPSYILAFLYAIFYVVLFNAVSGTVGIVSGILLIFTRGDDFVLTTDLSNILTLIAYSVFFVVLAVLFICRRKNPAKEVAFRKFSIKVIPLAALFGYAANLILSLAIELIPFPESLYEQQENAYSALSDSSANLIISIITLALFTGIIEEIIFRGLVMSRLSTAFGKAWCVIISAVIFGVVHPTVISFVYATVLGLILGMIFIKYGSVVPCIIIHVFFNLAACIRFPKNPLLFLGMTFICLAVTVFTLYLMFKKTDVAQEEINASASADA